METASIDRIGKTQEHDVGCVQRRPSGIGILAQFFGKDRQFYIVSVGKTLTDAKPRGACAAVNKYLGHNYLCINFSHFAFLTYIYVNMPSKMYKYSFSSKHMQILYTFAPTMSIV